MKTCEGNENTPQLHFMQMWSCPQKHGYIIWNEYFVHMLSFDKERITQCQITRLERPHLTSVSPKPAKRVSCCGVATFTCRCHLLCIYLGCYDDVQPQWSTWIIMVLEWMLPSQGIFAGTWAFWPRSTTHSGTHSICTSMKSFHAIRIEMKCKGPHGTFFFLPPTASQREGWNNGGIGLLQLSIETYRWNAQDYYEDKRAAVQSPKNDPHS